MSVRVDQTLRGTDTTSRRPEPIRSEPSVLSLGGTAPSSSRQVLINETWYNVATRKNLVTGDDLLTEGERPGRRRICFALRALRPARKVGLAVGQQTAGADDVLSELIASGEELFERNGL